MAFDRITVDPDKMGARLLSGLSNTSCDGGWDGTDGMGEEEILKAYPDLEREDIREALRYAAEAIREREILLV
jgi:hypothetical protein